MNYMEEVKDGFIKGGVATSSARQYLRNLVSLNAGKPFTNLNFLKKKTQVDAVISTYAPNTQKGLVTTIVRSTKGRKGFERIHSYYYQKMMDMNHKPIDAGKTDKQKENWIEWNDVLQKRDALKSGLNDWDIMLKYLVLSLYTEIPPRRNKDYMDMVVVSKYKPDLPTNKNYVCVDDGKFVFNQYKTSKKYGQQVEDIPVKLRKIIKQYLTNYPGELKEGSALLVDRHGSVLTAVNTITRILNSVFGKRVGASMLRHIYLTNKYGKELKSMEQDSAAMAHSMVQQREYIKN